MENTLALQSFFLIPVHVVEIRDPPLPIIKLWVTMKHKLPVKLKDVAVFLETQSLLAFGNGGQDLGGLEWGRGH